MQDNSIKTHFEEEAKEYDSIIIKLIPYYSQMVDALVSSITFNESDEIKVLDLGCGTGTISKAVSEKFPNANITCLDIASNMVEMAKHKLSDHKKTQFINGDFSKVDIPGTFDVVVSSLALHHLETDSDKINFYTRIFNFLNSGGIFINADVVLASDSIHQEMYMNKWIEFMCENVPESEILNKWIPTYKNEDRPAILSSQLNWLEEIGFNSADVIWKYYNFAVYCGIK